MNRCLDARGRVPGIAASVLLGSSLLLSGCGVLTGIKDAVIPRKPGERMIEEPEATAKRLDCDFAKVKFTADKVEVKPEQVSRGGRVNHRLRYALCPEAGSTVVKGKISRRLIANDEVVLEKEDDHTFKAGTWTLDVNMTIPKDAPVGIYSLDLTIRYGEKALDRSSRFFVESE